MCVLLGLAIFASPARTENNDGKGRGTAGAFVLDDDDEGHRGAESEDEDDDGDDEDGSGSDDDDGGDRGAAGQPVQPGPPPAPVATPAPAGEDDDVRGKGGEGHRRNGHTGEEHEPGSHRPDHSRGSRGTEPEESRPPPAPTSDDDARLDRDEVEAGGPEPPPAQPPAAGSDRGAGGSGTAGPVGDEPSGQGAPGVPPAPGTDTGAPGSAFVPPGPRGPLPDQPGSQENGSQRDSAPGRNPGGRDRSGGGSPVPTTPGAAAGGVPASGALASASGAPTEAAPADGAGDDLEPGSGDGRPSGRSFVSSVVAAADAARPVGDSTPAVRIIREIPTEYRIALIALAFIALLLLGIAIRAWRRSVRAERVALVDALTGVANRQAFERQLAAEWTRAERYRRNLGLLLLDIDGLKQINDDRGHAAGDQALRRAAGSIAARVRESDTVARIGGDEFVVICPETPTPGLKRLAGALEEDFEHLPVGVSVGFAQRVAGDKSPSDLLDRADAAMYRNKRSRTGLFARTAS